MSSSYKPFELFTVLAPVAAGFLSEGLRLEGGFGFHAFLNRLELKLLEMFVFKAF